MADNGTSIQDSNEFLEHLKILKEEFAFLTDKLGFEIKLNEWSSREYTTIFEKENVQVCIIYEPGTYSNVSIVNTDLPYDESKKIYNFDDLGICNKENAIELANRINLKKGVLDTHYNNA